MKKYAWLLLAFSLLFGSCRKDQIIISDSATMLDEPVVVGKGSVYGVVVDEEGRSVAGAAIQIAGMTLESDANGLFQLLDRDLILNAAGTPISVQKTGYFQGSTRIFPRPASQHFVKIRLLPIQLVGSISAVSGGTLDFAGAQLSLPANAVVDAAGNPFSGDIQIAAHWIDPTSPTLNETMPGALLGVDQANNLVGMATFGMVAVSLLDGSGNELQLAEGQSAELAFPIPASLQANAPATIPLWSFDETELLWIEEGTAQLEGDRYVGAVAHFSFWNCDAPFSLVRLQAQVLRPNGVYLNGYLARVTVADLGISSHGYINSEGFFGGKVPKDQLLIIDILDLCGEVVVRQEVGPLSQDTELDIPLLYAHPDGSTIVRGTLQGCDLNPLADKLIQISWQAHDYWAVSGSTGEFYAEIEACNLSTEMLRIQAFDLENGLQSMAMEVSSAPEVDLGNIQVCAQSIDEFINLTLDGEHAVVLAPYYHIVLDTTQVGHEAYFGGDAPLTDDFYFNAGFYVRNNQIGTYTDHDRSISITKRRTSDPEFGEFYGCTTGVCPPVNSISITASGMSGDYLEGSFSGTIKKNVGMPPYSYVPIEGTFRIQIP